MVVDVVNAHDVHLVHFNSQFVQMCKMYTLTVVLDGHWRDYLEKDGHERICRVTSEDA